MGRMTIKRDRLARAVAAGATTAVEAANDAGMHPISAYRALADASVKSRIEAYRGTLSDRCRSGANVAAATLATHPDVGSDPDLAAKVLVATTASLRNLADVDQDDGRDPDLFALAAYRARYQRAAYRLLSLAGERRARLERRLWRELSRGRATSGLEPPAIETTAAEAQEPTPVSPEGVVSR